MVSIPRSGLIKVVENNMKARGKDLLFCSLSGSHIFGLERPDSDYDVRGIYGDPPERFLGFRSSTDTVEFTDELDGVKVDGQFYELEKFFKLLCKGNGNMVTQVMSPIILHHNLIIQQIVRLGITRKLKYYYRGYAQSQRKRAMSERGSKALIYTYREAFSGLYVLKYGKLEYNFDSLLGKAVENGWYPSQGGMLYRYYPGAVGRNLPITPDEWQEFWIEWENLDQLLEIVAETSPLPEPSPLLAEHCEYLLLHYRKGMVERWVTQ